MIQFEKFSSDVRFIPAAQAPMDSACSQLEVEGAPLDFILPDLRLSRGICTCFSS